MILFRSFVFLLLAVGPIASFHFARADDLTNSARELLDREGLEAYRGWIKYLIFDVEVVSKRPGVDEAQALEKRERLQSWTQRIKADPKVIETLRGVQEWAYESLADGSGQPFMINIPQDYDRTRRTPLSLYMHGYAGNHSEHYNGSNDLHGMFELSVLGRSRGGGYASLSGADVIGVLDYVEAHWNIDPDRIHLNGGSMGGHGTYRMGSLYPHRFASGRPTCGFASDKPLGNLVTLPIYATHSDDDPVVPIQHSEGPIQRIRELGGQAIFDWTTGLGHASWEYAEGNARANRWFREQVRPDSKEVRRIDYTAMSGIATRSWWAEIEEWGDQPKPAHFILSAGNDNTLYATFTNIARLKLRFEESPFDPSRTLRVSVNGGPLLELAAPVSDDVYIVRGEDGWQLTDATDVPAHRRHTPGGPNLLYNGEPLLIVYGTTGSDSENEAMLNAAGLASRSMNARWQSPNPHVAPDGFSHNQLLYGNLITKADSDVTQEDIARCHLVLIGTAAQNSIVAGISSRLPVALDATTIMFADGEHYAADGLGLGLVHYNPDAPDNLIFWVASNDAGLYRADSPIPERMAFQVSATLNNGVAPGYDCLVLGVDDGAFIAARSFDHEWNLNPRDSHEPIIASSVATNADLSEALATAASAETSSDFGFFGTPPEVDLSKSPFVPGVTRLEDYASTYLHEPVGVFNLSGAQLLEIQSKLEAAGQTLRPLPTMDNVDPDRSYTLAMSQINIWGFVGLTQMFPRDYRLTDTQLATAISRHFPTE